MKGFDILGHKVKLKADRLDTNTTPEEVVGLVREVAGSIRERTPELDSGEIFLLAALKIAEQRMELAHEYKENINILQSSLGEALDFIDQATLTQ